MGYIRIAKLTRNERVTVAVLLAAGGLVGELGRGYRFGPFALGGGLTIAGLQ